VDVSNYLVSGDTISIINAYMYVKSTNTLVTTAWQGTISNVGNIIQVPINANQLQVGQVYTLAVTFTANTNKRLTAFSTISVVS
jgi:hypothetical protein